LNDLKPDHVVGKVRKRDSTLGVFYDQITGDEDARVCKDIPDAACAGTCRAISLPICSLIFSLKWPTS